MEKRCHWVNLKNPAYIKYHDEEWGVPSHDDKYLFEMLVLETFQAGLSWECILNKREDFRKAFENFDYEKIALFDEEKIEELLGNAKIVRNRLKIKATIANARLFIKIKEEWGSFAKYIWHFTDGKIVKSAGEIKTHSPLSDEISRDLQKRGLKFVGSTIIYSYLQAIGVIDDHEPDCEKYAGAIRFKN